MATLAVLIWLTNAILFLLLYLPLDEENFHIQAAGCISFFGIFSGIASMIGLATFWDIYGKLPSATTMDLIFTLSKLQKEELTEAIRFTLFSGLWGLTIASSIWLLIRIKSRRSKPKTLKEQDHLTSPH